MKSKREIAYLLAIAILIGVSAQFYYTYNFRPRLDRQIKVYYNEDRELNKELISLTRDADQFVYFAVYTFTRADIKDALLAAKYRGLEVVGLIDREQTKKLEQQKDIVSELRENGVTVLEQDHMSIMHLKVMVTEKAYASGSYNWTSAATNLNDEVLETGSDEQVRAQYQAILENMFAKYGRMQ